MVVGVVVAFCCNIDPAPTCADAGSELCTLHPDLCAYGVFPSITRSKYSTWLVCVLHVTLSNYI